MLPPGHIAAGYLTAYEIIKIGKPELSQHQINELLVVGAIAGFIPDLDMFAAFAKVRSFTITDGKTNHRKFWSHSPLIWMAIGLVIYFTAWIASSTFFEYFGLIFWLGSWSHFILDSLDYGIHWFWPFSEQLFAVRNKEINLPNDEKEFFKYWWQFLKMYTQKLNFTFYTEIAILALAIFTLFKK